MVASSAVLGGPRLINGYSNGNPVARIFFCVLLVLAFGVEGIKLCNAYGKLLAKAIEKKV